MSFINLKEKVVQVKIVYYGPGRCGKTTNLEYINRTYRNQIVSEMVSLKTHGDRTLFFDFLPFNMGKIKGYDIKIQLYTVPGQVKYNATRKLVLRGVDGIVFVADAMAKQREKNIRSLNQLHENLLSYKESIFKIPLVMQYNKIDLKEHGIPILPTEVDGQDGQNTSRYKLSTSHFGLPKYLLDRLVDCYSPNAASNSLWLAI